MFKGPVYDGTVPYQAAEDQIDSSLVQPDQNEYVDFAARCGHHSEGSRSFDMSFFANSVYFQSTGQAI